MAGRPDLWQAIPPVDVMRFWTHRGFLSRPSQALRARFAKHSVERNDMVGGGLLPLWRPMAFWRGRPRLKSFQIAPRSPVGPGLSGVDRPVVLGRMARQRPNSFLVESD